MLHMHVVAMFLNISDKRGAFTAVEDFFGANTVTLQPEVAAFISVALTLTALCPVAVSEFELPHEAPVSFYDLRSSFLHIITRLLSCVPSHNWNSILKQ